MRERILCFPPGSGGNLGEVMAGLIQATSSLIQSNFVAFEGLAGAGKSTLLSALAADLRRKEITAVFLPELNLSPERQRTLDYLDAEAERVRWIEASPPGLLLISDRSVLSTIMVAAAKHLAEVEPMVTNWEDLLAWFSVPRSSAQIRFPGKVVLVTVDPVTSRERQLRRGKFRSLDSFFLAPAFIEHSFRIYEHIADILQSQGRIQVFRIDTTVGAPDAIAATLSSFLVPENSM